jgi:hypothetical protein
MGTCFGAARPVAPALHSALIAALDAEFDTMLHLAAVDEPAAPAAPTRAKPRYDEREINRKAVKHWGIIRNYLVDMRGRSMVRSLNPNYIAPDPNRARPPGCPQLKEFRGPAPWQPDGSIGAWVDVGTGQSGKSVVDLVIFLADGVDRRVAADFLAELVSRIVEVAA